MLTHVDLFSGIGGFALAASWAGFRTVVFCEKDEFCQGVLIKRFGAHVANTLHDGPCGEEADEAIKGGHESKDGVSIGSPIIPDIRNLDGAKWQGATLLTGGFPCQPFSQAGKRRGKDDDRHLWPEMLRVIAEARPRWVLGENVAGIINMELDTVLADLEGEGYEVGTVVIPAAAVNAPHRRDRVWIIANTRCEHGEGQEKPREYARAVCGEGTTPMSERSAENGRDMWDTPWIEVATEFCRVDDGVSDRVHRLKALGNAIVPQVACEIIRGIKMIERERQ